MKKQIEKQILIFTNALGYVENAHIDHGSVFANFSSTEDAVSYRNDLQEFMNEFFKGLFRVKEHKLWKSNGKDVYAFDIMDKLPLKEPEDSIIDSMLQLENEMAVGK